ncbi:MAG: hypothetical protein U0361_03390 [Nitrospiraceae bacterium]
MGVGAALGDFFKAWQDVSTKSTGSDGPNGSTAVKEAGVLTRPIQPVGQSAGGSTGILGRARSGKGITDINGYADQIADLNAQVNQREESAGQQANDLRTSAAGAQSAGEGDDRHLCAGRFDRPSRVHRQRSRPWWRGRRRTIFRAWPTARQRQGLSVLMYDAGNGAGAPLQSVITSRRLKRRVAGCRDTTIPSLQSTLNTLAAQLVSQVDTQHQAGYGLDGSATRASTLRPRVRVRRRSAW